MMKEEWYYSRRNTRPGTLARRQSLPKRRECYCDMSSLWSKNYLDWRCAGTAHLLNGRWDGTQESSRCTDGVDYAKR